MGVVRLGGLSLGLGLSLEVLEGEVGEETTNGDNAVDAEAAASGGGAVVGGVGVGVGFGDRVARLALQIANVQLRESLASLVAVADILESLGGILTGDIEQNLLTTRVLVDELAAVVDLVVDHDEDVLLGVVLSNILVSVLLRHGGRIGSKRCFFLIAGIRREILRKNERMRGPQEWICKREKEGREKHLEGDVN